jgi:hypothetical protein
MSSQQTSSAAQDTPRIGTSPTWQVAWTSTGTFTATGTHRRRLVGWAANEHTVSQLLAGWRQPSDPDEPLTWTGPAHQPPPHDFAEPPFLDLDEIDALITSSEAELAAIEAHILARRRQWVGIPVDTIIRDRAAELERTAPQQPVVPEPMLFWDHPPGVASGYGWVDPRAICETADLKWGQFSRRSESLAMMLESLLATTNLRGTLVNDFLAPDEFDLVSLRRVPGPRGGALFELASHGSHRIHAARILDLPWLFATQNCERTPTTVQLHNGEVTRVQRAELIGIWEGLVARGVVDGSVDAGWIPALQNMRRPPALWLLGLPERACILNRAYETVHPGALAAAGIPAQIATDPTAWRRWLLGPAWRQWWRLLTDRSGPRW